MTTIGTLILGSDVRSSHDRTPPIHSAQVVQPDHSSADHSCWYPDGYHGTPLVTTIVMIQDVGHFKQVSFDGVLNRARASDAKKLKLDEAYYAGFNSHALHFGTKVGLS